MNGTSEHLIGELPILVLIPHNRCNCRCLMCDIWKIRQIREITTEDLAPHLESMRTLHVKWVVLSGGEALMHSDLTALCRPLRMEGIRLTLLSSGLSLERHAASVAEVFDDVIVSIDGPPLIHDRIRGVTNAYHQLQSGVAALRSLRWEIPVHGRCTVQKQNCRDLRNTVLASHELNLDSVSFLAVDLTSAAFNRSEGWPPERRTETALTAHDVDDFRREIDLLISEHHLDIESGFVVERPEKLHRLVDLFRSHLGQVQATSPRCNAPWVSAVIEADGTVRPCFFHNAVGNIHEGSLIDILNGREALTFREQLDVATNPICRNCVCSLFLPRSPGA
jgi:Fe-coproporphyrin III synthase